MHIILYLSTVFCTFLACEKPANNTHELKGNWGLTQTELYEAGTLVGQASPQEITTYYHFESTDSGNSTWELTITEDGESEHYPCLYEPQKNHFTLTQSNTYYIEKLSASELIIYKDYSHFRSRYSFQKVI